MLNEIAYPLLAENCSNKKERASCGQKAGGKYDETRNNRLQRSGDLPSGGERVASDVDDILSEDVARLLGHALAQVLVVDLDAGHIARISWDDGRLLLSRALHSADTQNTTVKHTGDACDERCPGRGETETVKLTLMPMSL